MARIALVAACLVMLGAAFARAGDHAQAPGRGVWKIPPEAATEENPLIVNASVLAAGRKVYVAKCQRCHGPEGKGDGPDADSTPEMDLRQVSRASQNPDGVVFYKIWNGRLKPKMPTFSEELSREQVWAIVAYIQSIRTVK